MSIRPALLIHVALLSSGLLSACATSRQIVVDYPKTDTLPLTPIKGQSSVSSDDYYVQIVSEFAFKGDNALKTGCSDLGASYESGDLSAAVLFNVNNEALKLKRETSGFLYQATTGKCNFKLETKKANLTPWLRLDAAKDTQVEYSFLTSNSQEANLSQLVGDINAASSLMALTGVGTGIAVMGQLAGSWVDASAAQPAVNKPSSSAKYSSETHNLPASVVLGSDGGHLNQSRLEVYEVVDGGMKAWASETKLLGELRVYPELQPSLLLKAAVDGVPDAHDLSLDELLRLPIQTPAGEIPLRQLIDQVDQAEKPNLQPDWQQYGEVENQCRRLKLVLKGLGFNKFDRNAVLYYFLSKSADWKNFNISPQKAMTDAIRPRVLEQYRSRDFSGCLASEDYAAMQGMRLPVNSMQDWDSLTSDRQKKEGVISSVQSVGRQLVTALSHPENEEISRQLYPLVSTEKDGNGTVLLQNHLGNFGLESLLQLPGIPDEGVVISAAQFATVIAGLKVDSFSCVRPALEQGKPLANIGIALFAGKPGSPREKGGALEFEVAQGKIIRLAFQHPSYRDFEQTIADYPDLGGCRIEVDFLNKLH